MPFLRALKALKTTAQATNGWLVTSLLNLDSSRTIGADAPLDQTIVLHEPVGDELMILRLHSSIQQLQSDIVTHRIVTVEAWTSDTVDG